MRRWMAAVALIMLTASCGGDDDDGASPAPQNAQDVLDQREDEAATKLAFGDEAEQDGVKVLVAGARWGEGEDGTTYRALEVDVRFENTTDEDVPSPLIVYRCTNSDETGNQHSGPIDPLDDLPGGTVADGVAELDVSQPCEDGWLEWDPDYDDVAFRWPMPTP